jgi:hypothetical protein
VLSAAAPANYALTITNCGFIGCTPQSAFSFVGALLIPILNISLFIKGTSQSDDNKVIDLSAGKFPHVIHAAHI